MCRVFGNGTLTHAIEPRFDKLAAADIDHRVREPPAEQHGLDMRWRPPASSRGRNLPATALRSAALYKLLDRTTWCPFHYQSGILRARRHPGTSHPNSVGSLRDRHTQSSSHPHSAAAGAAGHKAEGRVRHRPTPLRSLGSRSLAWCLSAPRALKVRLWCRRPCWMRCCAGDEGLALRRRPAGGDVKPPQAALAEDRRGERWGKGARKVRQVGTGKASVSEPLMTCRNKQLTSEPDRLNGSGMSLAGARLLARRCPAWRRRESGLRLLHGTWEGGCRHCRPGAGRRRGREGARRTAETGGAEYRRGICWRTGS